MLGTVVDYVACLWVISIKYHVIDPSCTMLIVESVTHRCGEEEAMISSALTHNRSRLTTKYSKEMWESGSLEEGSWFYVNIVQAGE